MARQDVLSFHSIFAILAVGLLCSAFDEDRKVYIVYMGSLPKGKYSPSSHHSSILNELISDSGGEGYLVRSYSRSFNGFAAKLSKEEQERLASMAGVISVFPSRTLRLHTTRSWDFMGFTENVKRIPAIESDIVIGVIDTGIWPESKSFSAEGFGPPPKKWKGVCRGGKNFTCNNKIIGARYYPLTSNDKTARDSLGHGSHAASIAAGNKVEGVSFNGLAQGNARGGVPSARIASYAVCHPPQGCLEEDVLAAFDDAIADGVDIITLSLGREYATELHLDAIAIGSFHAMEKGILTSNSAGNDGSMLATTASLAPWLLSVAASTTNRHIVDKVVLGNGRKIIGNSINSFRSTGNFPLIDGEDDKHLLCNWYLKSGSAKGKIVLCYELDGAGEAHRGGAVGSIIRVEDMDGHTDPVVPFPALALKAKDYDLVKSYMASTRNPQASILKSEVTEDSNAPVVASFSSLGPNILIPEILKPDIVAPGVGILAAYSPLASPSSSPDDKRSMKYSILSGTSMSCPHAAGAAAYVKSFHPDWSPSAIKSALMTTAWPMNATKNQAREFGYGSGHIDPVKAVDPGLVYQAYKEDYMKVLCGTGYDDKKLRLISGDNSTCSKILEGKSLPKDLNYPSMAASVQENKPFKVEFHRQVTNVGLANSIYKAELVPHSTVNIKVVPDVLSFKSMNEKQSFVVTVVGDLPAESMMSAALVWSDGTHRVRSPIVVYNTMYVPSA